MNGLLDDLLVGMVVLVGFGYAGYSLGPKSLRARLLSGAASLLRRAPVPKLRRAALRMAAAAGKANGSCGGCDNCGSKATSSEIRISPAKIGKRRAG